MSRRVSDSVMTNSSMPSVTDDAGEMRSPPPNTGELATATSVHCWVHVTPSTVTVTL